jgi:hypothetical protein
MPQSRRTRFHLGPDDPRTPAPDARVSPTPAVRLGPAVPARRPTVRREAA